MTALTYGAGHLALEGHPNLLLRHAVFHALLGGEADHSGRANDGHIEVVKLSEGHILDVVGDKALMEALGLHVVEAVDGVELLCLRESLQVIFKEDGIPILKAHDEVHGLDLLGVGGKVLQHTADRCHTRTACHHHKVLTLEALHREGVAVGAAHKEGVPLVHAEEAVGQATHLTDGELHIILAAGADGNGCFTDLGDGQHEELTVVGLAFIMDAEGILRLGLMDDLDDLVRLGQRDVVHLQFSPFFKFSTAAANLSMVSEKWISLGQRISQRPQPTHILPLPKRAL